MSKKVITFGLAAGAINLVTGFIFNLFWVENMDFSTGEILGFTSMLLALTMVFVGTKSYRDNELDGTITFGKAFKFGLIIVLIASLIYVIGWMLYFKYYMPDFNEKFLLYSIEQINTNNDFTAAEKETQITEMKSWMKSYENPLVMMAFTFLEIFPVGILVTLFSSWLLSRKKA